MTIHVLCPEVVCPLCDEASRLATKSLTLRLAGRDYTIDNLEFYKCAFCGFEFDTEESSTNTMKLFYDARTAWIKSWNLPMKPLADSKALRIWQRPKDD